jgi:ribosome-associated toxin RatA of RatAB toxin-antitoxin module
VFRILRDVERHPEFMPEVKEVRIVSSGPGYHVVYFRAGEGLFASEHTLRRTYDDAERRISWSLVQGRPKDLSGSWHVERSPDGAGSLVTYSAYIDAGTLVPSVLTRYFSKRTLPLMVDNLRKRAESGGQWQSDEYRKRSQ